MSETLPPERVAELAGALHRSDVNLPMDDPLDISCRDVAHALAPLIGGWLAEAEDRHPTLLPCDYDSGHEEGAAEVRERVEALAGEWERENAWGLGEQLSSAIRAALATGREEAEQ